MSVAVTLNVFVPGVDVSIDDPFGTEPVQVAMPEVASAHSYEADTAAPEAPSLRRRAPRWRRWAPSGRP